MCKKPMAQKRRENMACQLPPLSPIPFKYSELMAGGWEGGSKAKGQVTHCPSRAHVLQNRHICRYAT